MHYTYMPDPERVPAGWGEVSTQGRFTAILNKVGHGREHAVTAQRYTLWFVVTGLLTMPAIVYSLMPLVCAAGCGNPIVVSGHPGLHLQWQWSIQ